MYPGLTDLAGSELIRAIDRHLSGALSAALCFVPNAEWHEDGDYSALVTGQPHPFGNVIWNANLGAETAAQQIEAALAPIRKQGLPAAWFAGPGSKPGDLGERLIQHGLMLESSMPGMAVDLAGLQPPPLPPDTIVSEVTDEAEMREWTATFSAGYEIPRPVADCFGHWPAHLGYSSHSPLRAFLARQNGEAVACSLLFLSEGLAGMYCVATIPKARRQGLGMAVTAAPLRLAREMGYRTGVLQASAMGFSVYCRLGFEEFGKVSLYVLPPQTENETV